MKKFLLAFIFVLFCARLAFAHPPTDLKLEYDATQKLLSVKMRHVTSQTTEHYVRLITVSVNDAEPTVYRYTHQERASMVEVLLPLDAKPGDVIHVKANCLKGGSIQEDLELPKEEKKTP